MDDAASTGRLLIVDDDESICRSLSLIFNRLGMANETASRGEEALRLAREGPFDVALLDIKLPDVDGMELLRALREQWPDMAVIMLTAHASTDTAIQALNEGAAAYIRKPFNPDELLAAIRTSLEKQHLLRENKRLFKRAQDELARRQEAEDERERLRTQLYQADRMSNLGMIAASVAHEINTPLSYVLFNLESLSDAMPQMAWGIEHLAAAASGAPGDADTLTEAMSHTSVVRLDDLGHRLHDALEGARRVRDIARDLRVFSRVQEERNVPVSLNQVIECAVNMAYNEIRYRARLVKEYSEIPTVLANDGRLSQVFLNLLVNAAHAVDDGHVERNQIRVRTWSERGEVVAEIKDTGVGIPPDDLKRIFDPFFSTKQEGGCGLGLTICQNIVSSYGGTIGIDSEPGRGTQVTVRIPLRQPEEVMRRALTPPNLPAILAAPPIGRILVVDDDPLFGDAMHRALMDEFEVVVADSGAQAMKILERDRRFGLILCDLLMANVSGMELYEWLTEQHPELTGRVVFMTGGAFTPSARAFLREVPNIHLEKPFELHNLRALLKKLIDVDADVDADEP